MGEAKRRETFELSDDDINAIIDTLDETGGILIKESELKFWIEHWVNRDRRQRPSGDGQCKK